MERKLPAGDKSGEERATLVGIADELAEMKLSPPNADPYISAFAEAAHYLLTSSAGARLRESIEFMLEFRLAADSDTSAGKKEEPFTSLYAANLLLRSLQHTALFRRSYSIIFDNPETMLSYPAQFNNPGAWLQEINDILDNSTAHSVLDFDLTHRRVQSNVADRYKGVKLALLLHRPDFLDEPLDMLDVGASLNLGLTKLMINGKFNEIEVLKSPLLPGGLPGVVDNEHTAGINQLIGTPLNIASGTGVDILPVYDPSTSEWIRSCSFYPGELLDESKTQDFDRLVLASAVMDEEIARRVDLKRQIYNVNLGRLSRYKGDFSDRKSLRGLGDKAGTDKFHVISFVTMMHQLSDRERSSMIDRAKSHLHPDGIIVIQDFMDINPYAPNGLEFPHWTDFLYKTAVIDPRRPDLGPQAVITWDYGRCQQAILPASFEVP